jgi:hypothetical protein
MIGIAHSREAYGPERLLCPNMRYEVFLQENLFKISSWLCLYFLPTSNPKPLLLVE